MESFSRTNITIKNIRISFILYLFELLIRFFSRKVFLEYLGTEILGLNTTAQNILSFINLAELGIGSAVTITLYKPFFDGDFKVISEIITLYRHLYYRLSCVIIALAVITMLLFPLIFEKISLPLWYAYASFGVLLFCFTIGNFINYKQVLLLSAQKDYIIRYRIGISTLIKLIFQIFAVKYLNHGFIWWLILEVIFTIIGSISLWMVTKREFSTIKIVDIKLSQLIKKYYSISVKMRQLFFHKIGAVVLTEITPLVIYSYISLTEVALYGNYYIFITNTLKLCNASMQGVFSSTGNLVAEGDINRCVAVLNEIFHGRFVIGATSAFCLIVLVPPFITNWIGVQYLLGELSLWLMVAFLFIRINRFAIDAFINAFGLYGDTWAPIAEAIVNIGLSIVGGYYWGLDGILAGCMSGTAIIVIIWKPFYLYRRGFNTKALPYWLMYLKCLVMSAIAAAIVWALLHSWQINPASGWSGFIPYAAVTCSTFPCVLFALLFMTSKPMRSLTYRIIGTLKH